MKHLWSLLAAPTPAATPPDGANRAARRRATLALLLVAGLAGCAHGDPLGRAPDAQGMARVAGRPRFEPAAPALRLQPADTLAGSGCLSPMVEPERGVQLRMVRSGRGVGDYAAPEGTLGLAPGELLRLDCNTGRALGVVGRQGLFT